MRPRNRRHPQCPPTIDTAGPTDSARRRIPACRPMTTSSTKTSGMSHRGWTMSLPLHDEPDPTPTRAVLNRLASGPPRRPHRSMARLPRSIACAGTSGRAPGRLGSRRQSRECGGPHNRSFTARRSRTTSSFRTGSPSMTRSTNRRHRHGGTDHAQPPFRHSVNEPAGPFMIRDTTTIPTVMTRMPPIMMNSKTISVSTTLRAAQHVRRGQDPRSRCPRYPGRRFRRPLPPPT